MAHHAAILSICLAFLATVSCTQVKVHFMDYNSAEWNAVESNIKRVVTNELEDYCKISTSTCGLSSINNVSASVTFTGSKGTHTIDGRYAIVEISAVVSGTTLTKEILETFALDRRAAIVSGATAPIAFINDVLVFPARDQTDNYVIITISCTVVVGLFIINLVLTKKRNDEFKKRLTADQKKEIYASNTEPNQTSPKRKLSSKSDQEQMPLNTIESDNDNEDLIPAFPKAAEDPLLATSESYNGGLKVRLTQV